MISSYLDNAATTRVDKDVAELMQRIMLEDYGNPASLHSMGFRAERYIRDAQTTFAEILKCREGEIYFTSGGTESDNLALIGGYLANRRAGDHIITTRIEHAAVTESARYLESLGAKVSYLDVDSAGHVDMDMLKELLTPDTVLVSVMHVNNETGSLEPIEEIGKLIHDTNPSCLFHVDDVQGFGKLRLIPSACHVDMLSASSHKIHGPKGVGLFYKSDRAKVLPMIHGGGHQKGLRSGTENVPGVAGFALAASKAYEETDTSYERMKENREFFLDEIKDIPDIVINGGDVPYIISLSVKGVRAEVLLHSLEEREVYISAGSACSSHKPAVSPVLKAMGVEDWQKDSTVRISLSPHTTREEMAHAAASMLEVIPSLRRFIRK